MKLEDKLVYIDTFAKVHDVLSIYEGKEIRVSYSGGSDSDTVLWLLRYLNYNVKSVIYDTGLEYDATWRHVEYMRSLGFDIEIEKVSKTIPWGIKNKGAPFLSKHVSDMVQRLQYNNFNFKEDGKLSFGELYLKYPNAKSALRWWTNHNVYKGTNIDWNRGLKDFLIENNGVPFTPSAYCCYGAKKLPSKMYAKEHNVELLMLGIRRAEGGKRATAYPSCYIPKTAIYTYAIYLPIFWWTNEDKRYFDEVLEIKHSECYDSYGLKRTGCPGCPLGKNFENEITAIANHEPRLSKAVENLFGKSYAFTRKYVEHQEKTKPPRMTKENKKPDANIIEFKKKEIQWQKNQLWKKEKVKGLTTF